MDQVIITGASRGLGKCIAIEFAKQGAELGLIAKNESRLIELKKELIEKYKVQPKIYPVDLADMDAVTNLNFKLKADFQNLKILINNIGLFTVGDFETSKVKDLDYLMRLNLYATYSITQNFSLHFKTVKTGHIFNIGSIVSKLPKPMVFNYSISKMALNSFTIMLREELIQHGVKVTEIIPGSINTSSWDGEEVPKEAFIQPEEIAKVIVNCINFGTASNIEEMLIRPLNRDF